MMTYVITSLMSITLIYFGYCLGHKEYKPKGNDVEVTTLEKIKTYLTSDEEAYDPSKEE